jgi:hypothetical protein
VSPIVTQADPQTTPNSRIEASRICIAAYLRRGARRAAARRRMMKKP